MRFLTTNYKSLLLFSALIVIVSYLQYQILWPHLKYGFADVDWVFLLRFKNLPPFSLAQIIGEWQASGVYAYQTYYIGIQEIFYGLDYEKFHLTTNIFKFLSTITLFPLILYITGNRILAFITTIIYGITYPSIGAMYTVVTSGIYFAVFLMNIFLLIYAYTIKNQKSNWAWFLVMALLYYVALFFSTERLYPLIPILTLVEAFFLWRNKFSRLFLRNSLIRLLIVLAPLSIAVIYRPYAQTNIQFLGNTYLLFEKIILGNWHLLLVPFSVLGSMFIPKDYWKYFGSIDVTGISAYQNFYFFSPFIIYIILTMILAFALPRRKLLFIVLSLVPTALLGISSFFLSTNHLQIPEYLRKHYDPNVYLHSALFGQFLFSLSFAFFIEWVLSKFKNLMAFIMFFSIFFTFVFIFLTWLPSEPGLIFSNVHRYLTIPAIGTSLFVAGGMSMIFDRMRQIKYLKYFSYLVFLLIFPIIVMNSKVLAEYFKYELDFAGTRGSEHLRMKSKFVSFLGDFQANKPSLFFVDDISDYDNGYFHETTVLAGFDFWMAFRNKSEPDKGSLPALVRYGFFCPETDCLDKIRELITEQEGKKGILYANKFYPEDRVFFYQLKNRNVYFTNNEIKQKLGLK